MNFARSSRVQWSLREEKRRLPSLLVPSQGPPFLTQARTPAALLPLLPRYCYPPPGTPFRARVRSASRDQIQLAAAGPTPCEIGANPRILRNERMRPGQAPNHEPAAVRGPIAVAGCHVTIRMIGSIPHGGVQKSA